MNTVLQGQLKLVAGLLRLAGSHPRQEHQELESSLFQGFTCGCLLNLLNEQATPLQTNVKHCHDSLKPRSSTFLSYLTGHTRLVVDGGVV